MKSFVLRWLVAPISVVVIWAAVLLSVAPGASSGEQVPVERRADVRTSEFAIGTYELPAATATDDRAVHEDNHPPTF